MSPDKALGDADPFRRIVCGIDGSDASIDGVRQAVRLAAPDAEITLFGIANEDAALSIGWRDMPVSGATRVSHEAIEAGIEAARRLVPSEFKVHAGVVSGPPAQLSVVEAKVREATVVVVGSHGHRRGAGILIGSVTAALLHSAPCSVLVTRPVRETGFPQSIVVGLDGSEESRGAGVAGAELAARTGATLTPLVAMGGAAVDFAAVRSIADEIGGSPLTDDERDPVDALASVEADLLVVGSRGLRGVRALGSVSERAAHRAAATVLVVRGGQPGA